MKKLTKRSIAMLLTLCMVVSMFGTAAVFGASASSFTDISKTHWAYKYVDDVVSKGHFSGTSSTTFGPEVSMTRAMFVTVLSNVEKATVNNNATTSFTDVPSGEWYTGAIAWAAENDIVKGITDTTFEPNTPITREQMASLIVRYADHAKMTLGTSTSAVTFTDEAAISDYAKDAVKACQRAGLISGMGDGTFAPKGTATRAQVAAIISLLEGGPEEDDEDEDGVYTITFNSNGGSSVASQKVEEGEKVKKPSNPTRSGYSFDAWYSDKDLKEKYDFNTEVTKSFTLYAGWNVVSSGGTGGGGGTYYSLDFQFPAGVDVKYGNTTITTGHSISSVRSGTSVSFNAALTTPSTSQSLIVKVNDNAIYANANGDYSFNIRANSTVTIEIANRSASGTWNGQDLVAEQADPFITFNIPVDEIVGSTNRSIDVFFNEAVTGVAVVAPMDTLVKETHSGNKVTFTIESTATAADFNNYKAIGIEVTTASGTYNVSFYAAAVWNIEVVDADITLKFVEDVSGKAEGTVNGGETKYFSSEKGCDVFFKLTHAKGQVAMLDVVDYNGSKVELTANGDVDLTTVAGSAIVPLKTTANVASVTYNVKAYYVDKTQSDVSLYGSTINTVIDQYVRNVYVYLPVSDLKAEAGKATLTFNSSVTSAVAAAGTNNGIADSNISTSGSVVTVDFVSPSLGAFTDWGNADIIVKTANDTYNVSIYASPLFDITLGEGGQAKIHGGIGANDSSPILVTKDMNFVTERTVSGLSVEVIPSAEYLLQAPEVTVAGTAVTPTAVAGKTNAFDIASGDLGDHVYTIDFSFGKKVEAEYDGIAQVVDQNGTNVYLYLPLADIAADDETVTMTFDSAITNVAKPNTATANEITAQETGSTLAIKLASSADMDHYGPDQWATSDLTVTAGGVDYNISLHASAAFRIEYLEEGKELTIEESHENPGAPEILPAGLRYLVTDVVESDGTAVTVAYTTDASELSIFDRDDNEVGPTVTVAAKNYYIYAYDYKAIDPASDVEYDGAYYVDQGADAHLPGYLHIYLAAGSDVADNKIKVSFANDVEILDEASYVTATAMGKVVEIEITDATHADLSDWTKAEVEVQDTVTSAVYYISFYDSAAWTLTTEGAGDIKVFDTFGGSYRNCDNLDSTDVSKTVSGTTEIGDVKYELRPSSPNTTVTVTVTKDGETLIAGTDYTETTTSGVTTIEFAGANAVSSAEYTIDILFD